MKKKLLSIIMCTVMAAAVTVVPAFAADGAQNSAQEVKITVEGQPVVISADLGTPYIDANSRTMVPLRAMADALGVEVEWNQADTTARFYSKNDEKNDDSFTGYTDEQLGKQYEASREVLFKVGAAECTINITYVYDKQSADVDAADVNTTVVPMSTTTVNNNGRTYAPARYLAEAFGFNVDWEQATKTVMVTAPAENDYLGEFSYDELTAKGVSLTLFGIWHDDSLDYQQLSIGTEYAADSEVSAVNLSGAYVAGQNAVSSCLDEDILIQSNYDYDINARDGMTARFQESGLSVNCDAEGKLLDNDTNVCTLTYNVKMKDGTYGFVVDRFQIKYSPDKVCLGWERA